MLARRAHVVQAGVAKRNRVPLAHRLQIKRIHTIIKALDAEIDCRLDQQLDLLKGFKGVGRSTQAVLMSMLPELGHADRCGITFEAR